MVYNSTTRWQHSDKYPPQINRRGRRRFPTCETLPEVSIPFDLIGRRDGALGREKLLFKSAVLRGTPVRGIF